MFDHPKFQEVSPQRPALGVGSLTAAAGVLHSRCSCKVVGQWNSSEMSMKGSEMAEHLLWRGVLCSRARSAHKKLLHAPHNMDYSPTRWP